MHIVIPDELVPLLRHELFNDLHSQLEEAGVLVVSRGQADIRAAVDGCLGRADGTRALLDAVGWIEPVDPPVVVEISDEDRATAKAQQERAASGSDRTEVGPLQTSTLGPDQMSTLKTRHAGHTRAMSADRHVAGDSRTSSISA